jgi:purine-binding chemotaxis protein CheW
MAGEARRRGLVVHAGAGSCFLPLGDVFETLRPQPIESLAGMPSFVLGVSIIRGSPVPVVDLAELLGAPAVDPPGRFVTLRLGRRTVALAVSDVIGVRDLESARLEELPPLLRGAAEDVIHRIGTLDAEFLLVLQTGRVLTDDHWRTLSGQTA